MSGLDAVRKGDAETSLAALREAVAAFVRDRDWEQFHSPKNVSMALAVEAAELMEHFLWDSPEASLEKAGRESVRDEVADILLYVISFANATGMDLSTAIHDKMRKNAAKYPVGKARGRALKYTELDKQP